MIEYKSNIIIKLTNPKNPEAIKNIFPDSKFEDNTLHLDLKTIGSPDNQFPEIAKSIWWANGGFVEIEFFVQESRLSYSSPTKIVNPALND